jgi:SAM-dependent methyltransferase
VRTIKLLIGYARVSTDEQNLQLQLDALKKVSCKRIFTDKISGSRKECPGLEEALSHLRAGDTLIVWKLDRLGRTVKGLVDLITRLEADNITNPIGWHRWLFEQLNPPTQAAILEVGCGTAALWRVNDDRIPVSWNITLSDFSSGMIEAAQAQLANRNSRYSWAVVDAASIPYMDQSFDVVIANHMLYHVSDLQKTLREIRRVLKPNGRLYSATNGCNHMLEVDELIQAFIQHSFKDDTVRRFGLENGESQLLTQFKNVVLLRHSDSLKVTEAEDLVSYLLSMPGVQSADEGAVDAMRNHVTQKIAVDGCFGVTKDTGLFVSSPR